MNGLINNFHNNANCHQWAFLLTDSVLKIGKVRKGIKKPSNPELVPVGYGMNILIDVYFITSMITIITYQFFTYYLMPEFTPLIP